jgi:pimeloyl-ACP methyl ester carboxylesterase
MRGAVKILLLAAAIGVSPGSPGFAMSPSPEPTIVLVHGAFAESASWNRVIDKLRRDGYKAVAVANPLRGVADDGAAVASYLHSVPGPVVLVGHSYGGPVITEAANDSPNVKALVYVAAFAPDTGESDMFREQFAADVPEKIADQMAFTQRPILKAAFAELTKKPSWKVVPSYAIFGSRDLCIPPAVMSFMAERAHSRKTVVLKGASHALIVSKPQEVASIIEEAARESGADLAARAAE